MFQVDETRLTAEQRAMLAVWEQHLAAEFRLRDACASCDTMTAEPSVNHVPVLTGGRGRGPLEYFYGKYFIPQMPNDVTLAPVSRTIGVDRIVDEFVFQCTHSVRMDWYAPGVEATGRRLEVPTVVIVDLQNGKIAAERIYWDQATVLAQLGVLDSTKLPISRMEQARKVLDPRLPCNALMKRFVTDPRL